MAIHFENFVSIRKQYPRRTSHLEIADPSTRTERDYRDLLSEANVNFFHREYTIALENYLALRYRILVQSHPEMPTAPKGGYWFADFTSVPIDSKRLFELSRRYLVNTKPGSPVELNSGTKRLIQEGEFPVNQAVQKIAGTLGLDPQVASKAELIDRRNAARDLVSDGDLNGALKVYSDAKDRATKSGELKLAAELASEAGAMGATYADGANRINALKAAVTSFAEAEKLYNVLGDPTAAALAKNNQAQAQAEIPATGPTVITGPVVTLPTLPTIAGLAVLPQPRTTKFFSMPDGGVVKTAASVLAEKQVPKAAERRAGIVTSAGNATISLGRADYEANLVSNLYSQRVNATVVEGLAFFEEVETNFVAYIPHLYFFVLPIAIGDTYHALGRFQKAIDEYRSTHAYPFLNRGIEVPYVWLKMAKTALAWGDQLFRQNQPAAAKVQYEKIINTDLTVPNNSPLYQAAAMVPMRAIALDVVKLIRGQAASVNPAVASLIMQANIQLRKIAQGLNFLGLGVDEFPILRFKYLQGVANYLADNAIQAERTFMQFRSTAESQKMDRIQLESSVALNETALRVEQKRLQDASLDITAAQQNRDLANLRQTHAQQSLNDWNTIGSELASVNAALAWASNASNDQDIRYTGVQYDGESHNFSTNVEEFYDVVGEWRENLNFELQRRRLDRQISEAAGEVAIANTRVQQAQVRFETQQLSVQVAQQRLEGSREMLEYSQDRMFDEDLWFRLAAELQDLTRSYLDMAIYAAFLMERAYGLEFDRNLNRIRLDYGIGGVEGLLGGDYLKRDITSFTIDYMEHAQKKNPVRLAISLRDEFPSAFNLFQREGVLPFRTDLEIFDRRYAGTYRRKIKKIEIFVEGLVPLEGAVGTLLHQGIATEWRQTGANWAKHNRLVPAERLLLSSYQFRRDVTVFQPSEEMLELFENLGPQGNWTLELPRSSNNIDYQTISDIKFVIYFDSDFSPALKTFLRTFYPNDGGRSLILSSRFHFPDQYFRLDADRRVTFELHPARFAFNHTNLRMNAFSVRLVQKTGGPLGNVPLTVTRTSDNSNVSGSTNAQGALRSDPATMAPFAAWKNASPVDSFTVTFGPGVDLSRISDIQIAIDYTFTYRADSTLTP